MVGEGRVNSLLPRVWNSGGWEGVTEARQKRFYRNHRRNKESIITLLLIMVNMDQMLTMCRGLG